MTMYLRNVLLYPAAIALLFVTGCQTPGLMDTPNLYLDPVTSPFASISPELQTPTVDVLYATDRKPDVDETQSTYYGYERSTSLAYGVGTVTLGENLTWDELVQASTQEDRERKLMPSIAAVNEIARAPESNKRHTIIDDQMVTIPAVEAQEKAFEAEIGRTLEEMLRHTDRKEVFLFIHGYNVPFEASLVTIAEIWHFLGRVGVPVAYSWPAGRGGLRGYTTDRESGEFTVFHLKQFVRAISQSDVVEKIHVIAHSRGTDVALTAIRELYLETKHGAESAHPPKFGNLVLAAADLDLQVVGQRVGAEGLLTLPDRLTIYISAEDRAIGLASWLFDSVSRIGRLRSTDLDEIQKREVANALRINFVDARIKRKDLFGHSYFYQHPAVSSDLILVLRDNLDPGAANGRPLLREDLGFWEVYDEYPAPPKERSN